MKIYWEEQNKNIEIKIISFIRNIPHTYMIRK